MGLFNRNKQQAATAAQSTTARDPVCGMDVDPGKAAATSIYKGQMYYFCAAGCRKSFEADPDKYLKGGAQHGGGCCCH